MNIDTVTSSGARPNVEPSTPLPGAHGPSGSASSAMPHKTELAAAPVSVQPAQAADAARQVERQINEFLKSSSTSVEIGFDEPTNRFIVRIVEGDTKQVIRQIPSREIIAISRSLNQVTAGLLLTQKA